MSHNIEPIIIPRRRRNRSRSRSTSPRPRGFTPPPHSYDRRMPQPTMIMQPQPAPVLAIPPYLDSPLSPDTIELESLKDSKITGVSVYSARAEISRLFTVKVKAGLNQLLVQGLPQAIDQDSFRVEGRGTATIHDVALSHMQRPRPRVQASSDTLAELHTSKERVENSLNRTKDSIQAHKSYLLSVHSKHMDTAHLADAVINYEATSELLDDKVIGLEAQKKDILHQIQVEQARLQVGSENKFDERLSMKALISVFADVEDEIHIVLIYAVQHASWKPGYDIRVDMQTKGKPIQMTYKGIISQSTGEDWDNVILVLETASPTYGLTVPTLDTWSLSVKKPVVYPTHVHSYQPTYVPPQMTGGPMTDIMDMPGLAMPMSMSGAPMSYRGTDVSSKGTVSATFTVPGLISIPSDGHSHNVTITALFLESTMDWVCVPKKDTKTHLKAKIKNASEYTLLSGSANVYVDGSFISKTNVPLVSPDETFDCPLGLDPSIRVTYHPLSKKVSKSGFYSKSTNYVYQQRITVFNTKTHAIDGLKLLDQFPVSEDSEITVKHINPALVIPAAESTGTGSAISSTSSNPLSIKGIAPIKVTQGVVAQWDGADEVESGDVQIDAVGKNGKVAWICSIPAGSKLGLVLHWEVTTPVKTEVIGL